MHSDEELLRTIAARAGVDPQRLIALQKHFRAEAVYSAQISPGMLGTRELEQRYSLKGGTVRKWRAQGLPCIQLGRRIMVRVSDFERWYKQHFSHQKTASERAAHTYSRHQKP